MPGIAGIITRRPSLPAQRMLWEMVESMRHGEIDVAGNWIDESMGVYAGWTSLQESSCARMPLRSEDGNVTLLFSGEEYPEPGMIEWLRQHGHEVNEDGVSHLVHMYEEVASFPACLNGRFHGLIVDRNRGIARLFNDRFGMHRLYYHESDDAFYFASEAKAILQVCPELKRLDEQSLGEFVACGAVLENRTLFHGIHLLPTGSAWTFRRGMLEGKSTYFQPSEWEQQEALDPEGYYRELYAVFMQRFPRYFEGHAQIGMSLTGGLDTRIVLACRRPAADSLPCYTFGSMFRENQDVHVARRVAEACGQPHRVLIAGEEFLSRFAYYADRAVYLTDGCVDVSRAPDLYLNEKAREIAPVRMTGLYGGEILRRIRAFKPVEPAAGLFCSQFMSEVQRAKETYTQSIQCHPVSFAAFRQNPWYLFGSLALEQTQLTMRTPFLDNDFVRTVFRSPLSALSSNEVSLRLIADGRRDLLKIRTDRGLTANGNKLSHSFLEFLFKAEYAYDSGMPQWLARLNHAFGFLRLERMFLGQHKPFHFRVWYRDELAEYVQDMLLSESALSRPYIERKGLESMVRGHVKGNRNFTSELHKVLALELIQRRFLETPPHARERASGGQAISELVH
jgi:asparagine synthase (glutamine-hydrolysing)